MKKPKDWEQVKAFEQRRQLPAGGYICEVKKAEETTFSSGRPGLKVALEIAEGEYKGYFFDSFTRAKELNPDAKWPFAGTKWIPLEEQDGRTSRQLKAFVTSIEAENVKVSWDDRFCRSIQGALLGVVYGNEENEYNDVCYWRAVPKFFCSCEDIRTNNYNVPKDKPLDGYGGSKPSAADEPGPQFETLTEDIPF